MASLDRMASTYVRGVRIWARLKDEHGKWISKKTPFNVGDEAKAERYAAEVQRVLDVKRAAGGGPLTVTVFADRWLKERSTRDLSSYADDFGRIHNHVLPALGKLKLVEVRPSTIRDWVRALRKTELAPRTIRHVFWIAHAMFEDAFIDELIPANPCVLKAGELPEKTDKDSEWRDKATFTLVEVKELLRSDAVPVERRIQYALKSLAGLRHGEVAGLRIRHYDATAKPLRKLTVATSYDRGKTKTGATRLVPVHPALEAELDAWLKTWPEHYGRKPKPDDLLVPTRNMTMVDAADAVHAFKADLRALELRVEAGKHRDRGGHDLRAWFITSCQEAGAHRDLLRLVTHKSPADVMSGYTRATWAALCAEVSKLRFPANRRGRK